MEHKVTLLYVDDEEANRLLFKVSFRNTFNLLTADSGEEALQTLAENSDISIIISDLRMPGMSGLEFVNEAHKLHSDKHFYILSGIDSSDEIDLLIDRKVLTGYFKKPINVMNIIDELSTPTPQDHK